MAADRRGVSGNPDPRPPRRHVASRREWAVLRDAKLKPPCRGCQRSGALWLELHHLVGRDLGGDDCAPNLIPLCSRPAGDGCHEVYEKRMTGWRAISASIRMALEHDELAYVLERKGEDFLVRYYPL